MTQATNARRARLGRLARRTLAALLTVSGVTTTLHAQAGIAVGSTAPTARLVTLDGAAVDLASYVGTRPVLIEFFATWCPLCRKLEPQLHALHEKYGTRAEFVTITVPQNQSPERVKLYVEKNKLGGTFLFDRDGEAMKAFQVPHTSYVVVLDKTGKVVYTGVGADQDLEAALKTAFE